MAYVRQLPDILEACEAGDEGDESPPPPRLDWCLFSGVVPGSEIQRSRDPDNILVMAD